MDYLKAYEKQFVSQPMGSRDLKTRSDNVSSVLQYLLYQEPRSQVEVGVHGSRSKGGSYGHTVLTGKSS